MEIQSTLFSAHHPRRAGTRRHVRKMWDRGKHSLKIKIGLTSNAEVCLMSSSNVGQTSKANIDSILKPDVVFTTPYLGRRCIVVGINTMITQTPTLAVNSNFKGIAEDLSEF